LPWDARALGYAAAGALGAGAAGHVARRRSLAEVAVVPTGSAGRTIAF